MGANSNPRSFIRRRVFQCWTKGGSSTTEAEDLRPLATATMFEAIPMTKGLIGSFF